VVVELIHLATLVHDDIMDGARKRRGKPTAFAKWGAELSVLLGDCLFCHALKLSSNFSDPGIGRKIADAPTKSAAARFSRPSAGSISSSPSPNT
jgi:octaprenyl-diphosphate synthase